jgi:DNA-directed RNA polymerase specialized sigma24 family protein
MERLLMNDMPSDPAAISHIVRATRAGVIARLRAANEQYRSPDTERRQLMATAADLGLSVRQIAAITGDSHSSVATWVRRARKERDTGHDEVPGAEWVNRSAI